VIGLEFLRHRNRFLARFADIIFQQNQVTAGNMSVFASYMQGRFCLYKTMFFPGVRLALNTRNILMSKSQLQLKIFFTASGQATNENSHAYPLGTAIFKFPGQTS